MAVFEPVPVTPETKLTEAPCDPSSRFVPLNEAVETMLDSCEFSAVMAVCR